MNVAELVVACLENEGVRHVFALPGEETLALGLALEDSTAITQVIVRHEQGAAFMADVAEAHKVRFIDLFHQGIIDYLFIGREVETDWQAALSRLVSGGPGSS